MSASKYTEEQRLEAVELFRDHGPAEAARRTGVPGSTIKTWARDAGVRPDRQLKNMEAANAALELSRDQKRIKLQGLLLDSALDMLERMKEPHKEFKVTKNGIELLVHEQANSADCKNYGTTAAILIDKYRLEMGEATSRTENTSGIDERAQTYLQGYRDAFNKDLEPQST